MTNHGHLRHFAKVLKTTEKEWISKAGEDTQRFKRNCLGYLLKQEGFHRVDLIRFRDMNAESRTQED